MKVLRGLGAAPVVFLLAVLSTANSGGLGASLGGTGYDDRPEQRRAD